MVEDAPVSHFTSAEEGVPPGYKRTEVGVIPVEWDVSSLSELLEFRNGVNAEKRAYGDGVPFINVLEVIANTHIRSSVISGRIRLAGDVVDTFAVRRGDILFNRTSETQGEVGLASVYLGDETVVFGGFVIRGRQRAAVIHIVFAGYALRSSVVRSQIISRGQGVVRANIGQEDLSRVLVPLPPIPEQQTIAAALSDADTLIASLDKLIAKKRDVKAAAMQQLLTGRERLPGFSGEWEVKKLGDVAYVDVDSLSASTDPDFEFNYISLEDVDCGVLLSSVVHRFCLSPSRARRRLRFGDILVSTVRPNLKSHLLFQIDRGEWVCSTGFSVVRCSERFADCRFVFQQLFEGSVPAQIETLISGSNYPAINGADVRAFRIPMPPTIEEQRAIAAVLSDMDAEIVALEARRDKTRAIKQGMMQELLTGKTRLL